MVNPIEFHDEVERFLSASQLSPTRFGKEALNDPNFVFDLREGRSPSLETVGRVLEFISAHTEQKGAA